VGPVVHREFSPIHSDPGAIVPIDLWYLELTCLLIPHPRSHRLSPAF
jgi:hypothetical protein